MSLRINADLRNAIIDLWLTTFNGGLLCIYNSAQPASAGDDPVGDLLATIELPDDAFIRTATGEVSLNGLWQTTALLSGRAGWARFRNDADTHRMDVGITVGELELDQVDLVEGQTITVTALTVTMPSTNGG